MTSLSLGMKWKMLTMISKARCNLSTHVSPISSPPSLPLACSAPARRDFLQDVPPQLFLLPGTLFPRTAASLAPLFLSANYYFLAQMLPQSSSSRPLFPLFLVSLPYFVFFLGQLTPSEILDVYLLSICFSHWNIRSRGHI